MSQGRHVKLKGREFVFFNSCWGNLDFWNGNELFLCLVQEKLSNDHSIASLDSTKLGMISPSKSGESHHSLQNRKKLNFVSFPSIFSLVIIII